jgi:hypothetical protein
MYVQRNQAGHVVGIYANLQPGVATEQLADGHSDIAAFLAPAVPRVVTRRQARRALLDAGLLPSVSVAIAAMPSPYKERAQIDWDDAQTFDRDNPLLAQLAGALGLDDAALDALFTAAAAVV